jgi:FAD/FMN-containing dehydrogenase
MSATIENLAAEISAPPLHPDDTGYAEEVAGFNAAVVHRPDVVVRARGAGDVQAAVRFAARHGLRVAVQATGHGATTPFRDGLLISTRRMDEVSVDPAERTATVAAGTRWRQVIDAAAAYGLAPLSGSSSGVGAVGYCVGGGLPVMCRTFGYAADAVRAAELVTADGALHRLDPDHEPELFWGVRGGKGNLGIVTKMTVSLVPIRNVYGGGIFYAAERAADVFRAYADWCPTLPEETSTSVAMLRLPPLPELPEALRGRTVAHLRVCHVGDPRAGERLVAAMRAVAPALVDHVGEMPYSAVDAIHSDPDHPVPAYQAGELLRECTGATVDAVLAAAGPDVATPVIVCELRHLGGALARAPEGGNAVSWRDAPFCVSAVGLLTPDTAQAARSGVDGLIGAIQPWSAGATLLNMHGRPGDEPDRARAWDPATYQRLRELVARFDPAGMFDHEHAIGRDG